MRKKAFFFCVICFILILSLTCAISGQIVYGADIAPRYMKDTDGIYKRAAYCSDHVLYCGDELLARKDKALSCRDALYFNMMKTGNSSEQEAADKEETDATIMFTGDLMCLKGQQNAALSRGRYDFTPSFQYVKKIFDDSDLNVGNLETLISSSHPLTKDQVNAANGSPQCNGPVSYLRDLRRTGFDVLVTANNHCCDWGADGINETLDVLDIYNFIHTGTRKQDEDVPNYIIVNVKGINIGIISTTHLVNQRQLLSEAEMSRMVNNYSPETVRADIASAKASGADFVVVYAHWGIENTHEIVDYQAADAAFIAQAGADLIIGSHPHCLQRGDELVTSDGRTVPVVYSMGNFVSSMGREINNDTVILKVRLKKTADKVSIDSYDYIPCYVLSQDHVITPVSFSDESTAASWAGKKPFILHGMEQFIPSASHRSALIYARDRISKIFKISF